MIVASVGSSICCPPSLGVVGCDSTSSDSTRACGTAIDSAAVAYDCVELALDSDRSKVLGALNDVGGTCSEDSRVDGCGPGLGGDGGDGSSLARGTSVLDSAGSASFSDKEPESSAVVRCMSAALLVVRSLEGPADPGICWVSALGMSKSGGGPSKSWRDVDAAYAIASAP